MKKLLIIAPICLMTLLFLATISLADQTGQLAESGVPVQKVASPGVSISNVSLSSRQNQTLIKVRIKPSRKRLPSGQLHLVVLDAKGNLAFLESYEVRRHRSIRGKKAKDSRVEVSLPFVLQSGQSLHISYGQQMPPTVPKEQIGESDSLKQEEKVFEIIPQMGGVII